MRIEKLSPAFKDYLWGGTKLRDVYGKDCDFEKIAESWELSTHPAGQSRIAGGPFDGLTLGAYIETLGRDILGENGKKFEQFPVLIKFIDAKDPLSVQVHPSDAYALEHEGEYGKTEMWYVVDAEPGASLYFGVEKEMTQDEFRRRIAENTLTEALHKAPVQRGDVFFIESGTVHAIGAGILVCEIQQNSNTTYRVYDYGRVGADGKPRELHIEKAVAVSKLTPSDTSAAVRAPEKIPGGQKTLLASCPYFTTEKIEIDGTVFLEAGERSFLSVVLTEGEAEVAGPENTVPMKAAESVFVPAGTGTVKITGKCTAVVTAV